MKKNIILLTILTLFVSAPAIMAKSLEKKVIGTWSYKSGAVLTISPDHTMYMHVILEDHAYDPPKYEECNNAGTWSVSGHTMTFDIESSSVPPGQEPDLLYGPFPGESIIGTIQSVDSTSMTMTVDGYTMTMKRVS